MSKVSDYVMIKAELLVFAIVFGAVAWFALTLPDEPGLSREELLVLHGQIQESEAALSSYALAIAAGRVATLPEGDGFPLTELLGTALEERVSRIARDAVGNVYFTLEGPWEEAEVGFVLRNGGTELLAGREDLRLARELLLFGDWWYYTARR